MMDSIQQVQAIRSNLEKVILGKPEAVHHLIIGLLAGGDVLMEDVPGVGKTTLARALARAPWTDIFEDSVYCPTCCRPTFWV